MSRQFLAEAAPLLPSEVEALWRESQHDQTRSKTRRRMGEQAQCLSRAAPASETLGCHCAEWMMAEDGKLGHGEWMMTPKKRAAATLQNNDHEGAKPSDELFEFMLSIDGGPTNDSLRLHQEDQPSQLPAASSSKQHYYDADAAATIETSINHSICHPIEEEAPMSSGSTGCNDQGDGVVAKPDSLVGIAYVVEAPDDDEDGMTRWNASHSLQAFNRSPAAFDGFSVAFFGSSRPGSMRYLNSHRSMGSSESSMRSPGGDGDPGSHLCEAGNNGGYHHRFPFVLPRQRSTSNGTVSGSGGGGGVGSGGAFANFTYQETSALSA
ncbi:unnamed protein product [Bodo saltans]|uniref:Uncharacterized protein n=1 Tax=Bodo saltans TaxID=75058 RepID=A0A0S4JLY8_BODSA|nr:unnamed protein product [Bodo saltans]|eukprot:CUG92528.1 unnamed protein product [Bodo saltans]